MATVADLRTLVRDENSAVFTDAALQSALNASGDSLLRAAGIAFQGLAAEYATVGRSIKTDDLAIDTRSRGENLLKVAQSYFAEAAAADEAAADSIFQVVGRTPRATPFFPVVPEGTPWPIPSPLVDGPDLIPDPDYPGYWTTA